MYCGTELPGEEEEKEEEWFTQGPVEETEDQEEKEGEEPETEVEEETEDPQEETAPEQDAEQEVWDACAQKEDTIPVMVSRPQPGWATASISMVAP